MTATQKIICGLFFILLTLSCLQTEYFAFSVANINLKFYHIFSLCFLPILFGCCYRSLIIPPKIVCFYFLLVFIVSLFTIPAYGLGNPLIAYIWGAFIIIVICSIGKYIEFDSIISIFQKVAVLFSMAVWIKNFLNKEAFIIFFINPNVHPIIPTLSQGGVNLEATWIALFGFFFKSKKGYIYLFAALFLSILYASRVGIILNFLHFCWLTYHIYLKNGLLSLKRLLQVSFIIFLLGAFFLTSPLATVILNRLAESGETNEAGSRGRIAMWINFPSAFVNNPMGYGAGNAMKAIELIAGRNFEEVNMHNMYMQNALDFGVMGLFVYIVIVFAFLLKERKTAFSNPFAGALLGYILASFIQFGGSENLLFIFVGFYLVTSKQIQQKGNR